MLEEPHPQEVEEKEKPLLPPFAKPDELRWWELQLGVAIPGCLYTESPAGP